MLFSEVISYAVESALRYVWFFLLLPARVAGRAVWRLLGRLAGRWRQKRQKKERMRYTAWVYAHAAADACGFLQAPQLPKKTLKKGKRYVQGTKKAVQPKSDPACFSDSDRGGFHRGVCK